MTCFVIRIGLNFNESIKNVVICFILVDKIVGKLYLKEETVFVGGDRADRGLWGTGIVDSEWCECNEK